jgi:two-component system sensor histidine kinase RegB
VALRISAQDGWLELRVRDHGPGFDEDTRVGALGQSQKQTGLGIGLALADATAERLNGELIARSNDGGAEVCLRLPLAGITD